jgi:membrane associated rhomboid family serine protease
MLGPIRQCLGSVGRRWLRYVARPLQVDSPGCRPGFVEQRSTCHEAGVSLMSSSLLAEKLRVQLQTPVWRMARFYRWSGARASAAPAVWSGLGGLAVLGHCVSHNESDTFNLSGVSQTRDKLPSGSKEQHAGPQALCFRPGDLEQNLDALLDWVRSMGDRVRRSWASREGRTILSLILLNGLVYLAWKSRPGGPPFMWRHFACSLESLYAGRTHTLLTSSISHMGFLHLLGNMFLLANFGLDVCKVLGPSRFLTLYAGGAFLSSAMSLLYKRLRLSGAVSIGASGSVMAVLVMFAMLFPRSSLYVMGIKMTAQEACLLWVLFDVIGVVGRFGYIDFAAHLGGAIFGYLYFVYIEEHLREELALRRRARRWGLGSRTTEGPASGGGSLLSRLDAVLEWLQRRRDPTQRRTAERADEQSRRADSGWGSWFGRQFWGTPTTAAQGERPQPQKTSTPEKEPGTVWERLRRFFFADSNDDKHK